MFGRKRTLQAALLLFASIALTGCETLSFYGQAVGGQLSILTARQPIDELVATTPDSALATRLAVVGEILRHADAMQLSAGRRYSSYVALSRRYVVWNVFAATPYSASGHQWCYPIVGCAPYRGYFDEARAQAKAEQLRAQGFETFVGGVPAYSTLGWFADPVLSTFIDWPDAQLASLLIHELAHGKVWVNGDVAFNESFASFVGEQGAQEWLQAQGRADEHAQWRARMAQWRRFVAFAAQARTMLQTSYEATGGLPEAARRAAKEQTWQSVRACYAAHRDALGGGRFDQLVANQMNNAYLASIGTYEDFLPAFRRLYQRSGSWPTFFAEVEALANLTAVERGQALQRLLGAAGHAAPEPLCTAKSGEQQVTHQADREDADEVHREALSGHRLQAEPPGGEDDHVGWGGNGHHEGATG